MNVMATLTKAVFPVAGLGTRFLPATKTNPKEMLPIVDKPLIQYATEEAIAAGITELIFVTGRTKRAIEDHFDKAYELETELERAGKQELLTIARETLPEGITCTYIRQPEALGLGHAVLCAKHIIGDEYFAVMLADDLIDAGESGCLGQLADLHRRHGCGVVAVENVPPEDTNKYGIVEVERRDGVAAMKSIVEKPDPSVAPSTLGVVGRYILPGSIMGLLANTPRGAGNEIQLTDAISTLLEREQLLICEFDGIRYDCGSKLGYLKATVDFALKRPEYHDAFAAFLNARN